MTLAKFGGPDYDARVRRAQHLGAIHPFAAEVMTFYQHLAQFQKRLYSHLAQPTTRHPAPASAAQFRSSLDLALLLQYFPELLSLLLPELLPLPSPPAGVLALEHATAAPPNASINSRRRVGIAM